LRQIATEFDVADRIHILTPAAPSEMERLAASYDLGLSGETGHTRNRRIALPNKLFSYLLAGLPMALSDIPAHRELSCRLGEAARLYAADDADSLANVIDAFVSEPTVLAQARAAAFRLGQTQFNWDIERSILLKYS
jgi:hypothetical protein